MVVGFFLLKRKHMDDTPKEDRRLTLEKMHKHMVSDDYFDSNIDKCTDKILEEIEHRKLMRKYEGVLNIDPLRLFTSALIAVVVISSIYFWYINFP